MGWTLIESQTLSISVASVTFGSGGTIPQTFKTLKLIVSSRFDANVGDIAITLNGSSSNFSYKHLYGTGSGAGSGSGSANFVGEGERSTLTASTFNSMEITIPNYSGSSSKSISSDAVSENNAATSGQVMLAGLWSNSAAITSIGLTYFGGTAANFVSGTTFQLYGLK
jgi:hypothetical protein